MKAFLVFLRVVACALCKDEATRETVVKWLYRVLRVTNDDVVRAVRSPDYLTRVYSMPDARSVFHKCSELGLLARDGFYSQAIDDVAAVWNGIGPDTWPIGMREWLSDRLDVVLPCSMPHDDWYSNGNDGTEETWKRTMREWRTNSKKCLAISAQTCSILTRLGNWYLAELASQALEIGGYACWKAAYKRNQP